MKQMLTDCNQPFLPMEIIACILKWIPAKSLIQFQSVSKDWKNLINSKSFIYDHVHHTNLNPNLLIERPFSRDSLSLDREMQLCKLETPWIDRLSWTRIVGSSYGLICARIEDDQPCFLLWNPAIREVRSVHIRTSTNQIEGQWISGFGFSTVVNDYKIVNFFVSKNDSLIKQVEVYSFSTGLWNELEFDLEGVMHFSSETVSTNGVIFWHGSKTGWATEDDDFLLSFDIATELFTLMPWPALTRVRSKAVSYHNKLTVYDNKLALLFHTKVGDYCPSSLIDLWVMEEGMDASVERWIWTKKYTTAMFSMCLLPICIWRNHIVCRVCESPAEPIAYRNPVTVLSLLNPRTYDIKKIDVPAFSAALNYCESLISVANVHKEEPSSSSS